MRSSPLCSGLQLASHGTVPRNWASSVVSVGKIDSLRRPAQSAQNSSCPEGCEWITHLVGCAWLKSSGQKSMNRRTVHQFVYFYVPKSGHTKADVGCHWTFWQAAFQLTFSVFQIAGHPSDNGKFKENGELIFWVRYVGRQVGLQFCMSLFFLWHFCCSRPVYNSYVAARSLWSKSCSRRDPKKSSHFRLTLDAEIRNAAQFDLEKSCEESAMTSISPFVKGENVWMWWIDVGKL